MYYLISCRLPEAAIEMMLVLLLSSSDAAAVDDVCSLPLLGTITRCVFSPRDMYVIDEPLRLCSLLCTSTSCIYRYSWIDTVYELIPIVLL